MKTLAQEHNTGSESMWTTAKEKESKSVFKLLIKSVLVTAESVLQSCGQLKKLFCCTRAR